MYDFLSFFSWPDEMRRISIAEKHGLKASQVRKWFVRRRNKAASENPQMKNLFLHHPPLQSVILNIIARQFYITKTKNQYYFQK